MDHIGYAIYREIWPALGQGATSALARPPASLAVASAQVVGVFGGATLTLEVSNDGVTWFVLDNKEGTPISLTAPALVEISSAALHIRARVLGGNGTTAITVTLIAWGA